MSRAQFFHIVNTTRVFTVWATNISKWWLIISTTQHRNNLICEQMSTRGRTAFSNRKISHLFGSLLLPYWQFILSNSYNYSYFLKICFNVCYTMLVIPRNHLYVIVKVSYNLTITTTFVICKTGRYFWETYLPTGILESVILQVI